jgi:pre-mRNA-splicing factor 18
VVVGGVGAEEDDKELVTDFAAAAKAIAKQRAVATMKPIDQVGAFFKGLLEEWEKELDSKSEEWIYSDLGRQSIANCRLCRNHMKPMFKRIKRRDLPGDIERALFLMVRAMKSRNYRQAADVYVGLAIGNAPWPIGVTSVGIHERSAREKIGAQSQAHAMHDEETRKYLQSVKRLMTFAQRIYPTVPSLSLDFNSGYNGWDKDSLLIEDAKLDIKHSVPALLVNTHP